MQGNNVNAIYTLGENELAWMNFDLVLTCACHDDLQPSLRSKFVQLMTGEFMVRLSNVL